MALELLSHTITSRRVANLEKVATGISHTKVLLAVDASLILAVTSPLFGCAPGYEPGLVTPSPDLSGLTEPEKSRMESIKTSFIKASENGKIISSLDKKTRGSVQELLAISISQATKENITADQINGFSTEDVIPNWTESVGLIATDVSYVDHDGSTKTLRFMFGQGDPGSEWGQVNFFVEGKKPDENGNIQPDFALDVSNGKEPKIWGLEIVSNNEAGFSRQLFFTKDSNGNPVILNHSPDSSITDIVTPVSPNANFLIGDGPPNDDGTVNVSFKFAVPAKIDLTATPTIAKESFVERDASGKLVNVKDIYGNVIKATHEVKVADATEADWASVNERLGTEFAINSDGTITGVEGLNINMANGEATFNFDGKGVETYHIANIKSQEVNGENRLLVGGYSWNSESKSWEVFNPGFPMEDPRLLGWSNEADRANGNRLRFHQRVLEDRAIKEGFVKTDGTADMKAFMKKLFTDENGNPALVPTKYKFLEFKTDTNMIKDPKQYIHYGSIWWENPDLIEAFNKGEAEFLTRDQFPTREGLSIVYNTDLDAAEISIEFLNGDESTTPLFVEMDRKIAWENNKNFLAMLAEACGVDESVIEKVTGLKKSAENKVYRQDMIWPSLLYYPDQKAIVPVSDKIREVLNDQAGIDRRKAMINGNKIELSAATETFAPIIIYAKAIQYWQRQVNN